MDSEHDHELLVVTAASCEAGTLPLYLSQLRAAGIPYEIESLAGIQQHQLNLGFKVLWLRMLGEKYSTYSHLVCTDAFDVTFYGTRESVLDKLANIPPSTVLWGAEKNCYPNPAVADRIPKRTPWCFANGGLWAGTPRALVEWSYAVERHPSFLPGFLDQEFHNERVAEGSELCRIDDQTSLFFCLFGGYDELEFERGVPVNRLLGTHPQFLHANGKWSAAEMFAKYERSLQP